jgi:beta-aspartyl-peptidase (threonine type)
MNTKSAARWVIGFTLTAVALFAARAEPPADEAKAIRAVLDAQCAAWNRGDLEGYMDGYWRDAQMTFYSGNDVTRGWQPTLERYRRRYQGEGRAMGKLTFADVEAAALGGEHGYARGRWKVDFPDGKSSEGLFTLILRRVDGKWRVVHDHTSAKSG